MAAPQAAQLPGRFRRTLDFSFQSSANFLNRNDSQAKLTRWKWPATAMFNDVAVDRVGVERAAKCSRDRIFVRAC
jgi:hypothetical protein